VDHAYFTMPLHPLTRSYTDTLREDRAVIVLAEKLGFREAYVGEHVTDLAETVTSSAVFLASLVDSTSTIRLGTGTVNLPNSHPAHVAAQIAMLDHLLEGRLIFGISPGGLLSDAEMFGNLGADRTAMFVEAIDHVLALWTEEPPFRRAGRYWTLSTEKTWIAALGQGGMVRPFQRPHPPIVVTVVAPYSKGIVAAAKRGWQPISANFLHPAWVATHWPLYAEGRQAAGAVADVRDWRVARSIFVADDMCTAERYGKESGGPYAHYYRSLMTKLVSNGRVNLFKARADQPDSDVTLESTVDSLVIAGTVDSVVDQVLALREQVGEFGTLVYAGHDWLDPALARRSMELFAEQVMPRVNAAIADDNRGHGSAGDARGAA
jgi:alkanesulfonate monooxygenase SsuD/methylene tetrahydromethanopterin reductase-like flavin-dependent oxidoreductase (luciferase family)